MMLWSDDTMNIYVYIQDTVLTLHTLFNTNYNPTL